MDVMIITSDPTVKGIRTAGKLRRLAEELELDIGRTYLVVNRARDDLDQAVRGEIEKEGLDLLGVVPEDEVVLRYDLERRSLLELPSDSVAYAAVKGIMGKLNIP